MKKESKITMNNCEHELTTINMMLRHSLLICLYKTIVNIIQFLLF